MDKFHRSASKKWFNIQLNLLNFIYFIYDKFVKNLAKKYNFNKHHHLFLFGRAILTDVGFFDIRFLKWPLFFFALPQRLAFPKLITGLVSFLELGYGFTFFFPLTFIYPFPQLKADLIILELKNRIILLSVVSFPFSIGFLTFHSGVFSNTVWRIFSLFTREGWWV